MGIYWIASYPKSGNTWLRAFIANVISPKRPVPLDELGRYCASEANAALYKAFGDIQTMDARPGVETMELRQQAQERASLNATPRHILLKTHNQRTSVKGLPLVREDLTVGAVYVVRDPRDVAVSLAAHADKSIDDAIALLDRKAATLGPNGPMEGRQMFELVGSWSDHVQSWTDSWHPRLTVLRYEDCLNDPESTLGRLPPLMGITSDIWRIKAAIAASSFDSLKAVEAEQGFAEKPKHADSFFNRGQAGLWKDLLTPAQAKKIERRHAKMMKRFNYL